MPINKIFFEYDKSTYCFDPQQPLDISIPLSEGENQVNCYYAEPIRFQTYRIGNFVGSVAEGGSCNYQKISLTPHGNGTHTECYGHISADKEATIQNCLQQFLFFAQLVSVVPIFQNGDSIITLSQIEPLLTAPMPEALIIRTLPNTPEKLHKKYSNTNPTYLESAVCEFLAKKDVKHLLLDVPSADKEKDGGKLLAHKSFWQFPNAIRKSCTITELVYVNNDIPDGNYLLNLQIISLQTDASPSKPILYALQEISPKKKA
ncbi:MAG: cyclase family protein [Microscillaceae bacterium]|nr:cyclase family protein [Microscillaceae bacterium]MDW8461266.1 cyclase family protein [Cytophagales bacterium]